MAFFTSTYIETLEDVIVGEIDAVQYQINNEWSDCNIISSMTVGDYRVITYRIPSSANGVITALRMITSDGDVIAQSAQSITVNGTAAVTFQIKFKIVEGVFS